MPSHTSRIGLAVPQINSCSWGAQTNANWAILDSSVALTGAGAGGLLSSTQTWTGQNNWTTPAQSTFTYGLTMGSATINGSGAGAWQFNEGVDSTVYGPTSNKDNFWASSSSHTLVFNPNITSTYSVVGSSTPAPTPGNVAVWTSQFGLRDGGTDLSQLSPPINTVLYNNNGPVGNSSNFQFNGSSITILSSTSFTTSGSQNTINPAYVDVFDGKPGSPYLGKPLFTVGSFNQSAQLGVYDQTRIDESRYGAKVGHLEVGESSSLINHQIQDDNASTQLIDWWNNGEMDIQTTTNGNGGKNIVFRPSLVTEVVISSFGVTISTATTVSSSMTVTGQLTMGATAYVQALANDPNGTFNIQLNNGLVTHNAVAINDTSTNGTVLVFGGLSSNQTTLQNATGMSDLTGAFGSAGDSFQMGYNGIGLNLVGTTSNSFVLTVGTNTAGPYAVKISTSGHFITGGPAPTISSCGTTPNGSVMGDDNEGTITVGGGSVTSCTLTFAKTWGTTPICIITDNSTTSTGDVSAISATAFTTSFSLSVGGGTIWYQCGCSGTGCR